MSLTDQYVHRKLSRTRAYRNQRKRFMRAINERSESMLFTYLDTAACMFLVINTEHIVELVNKRGCEVLGYRANEIEGEDWFARFIPAEERTELSKLFDDIMLGSLDPPDDYENKVLTKDGSTRWIRWRNSLLKNEVGAITGLISSGEDITEERRTLDTLYLRNRALETAGNGIILADAADPDQPIIFCNTAFSKLTGYRKSEVLGRNCRFLQNDDRDQAAISAVAKALSKGEACKVLLRNYRKDGSMFWNELSITPLYDEEQQLTHFIGVQNDVTEIQNNRKRLKQYADTLEKLVESRTDEVKAAVQKLVEANLRMEEQVATTKYAENKAQRSQALFAAIAKNFPKGLIVVFNADYELVFVEGEELKSFNLKEREYEGKPITDIPLLSEQQVEYLKTDILKTIKGQSLTFEVQFRENCYAVDSTPLFSDLRDTTWALFVYHNITAQKEVQKELAKALKVEQELNELKSRFISMASHEFRTPLSAILSSAILIGKQNEPGKEDRRMKHVGRIRNNVKNLVVILNDFLSLGKLEEGKVKAAPTRFELNQFCKALVEEMESSRKDGQTIALTVEETDFYVVLDPKLLSHILINLLSNACKYSDVGKQIDFQARRERDTVVFTIADTGIGIPREEQRNLFERFFRAGNVVNIQGTGLGLHIVKQYAELMYGSVSFKSKLGKGSIFTVRLPINFDNYEKDTAH